MSVNTAVEQLLEVEERLQQGACAPGRTAVGLARVGSPSQKIVAGERACRCCLWLPGPGWARHTYWGCAAAGQAVACAARVLRQRATGPETALCWPARLCCSGGSWSSAGDWPAPACRLPAGTLAQLQSVDFGAPLHSLVIAGEVHDMEQEMLACFPPG